MEAPQLYTVSRALRSTLQYFGQLSSSHLFRYGLVVDSEEEVADNIAAKLEPYCAQESDDVLQILKTSRDFITSLIQTLEKDRVKAGKDPANPNP